MLNSTVTQDRLYNSDGNSISLRLGLCDEEEFAEPVRKLIYEQAVDNFLTCDITSLYLTFSD